jgi:hypothetical protein
VLKLALSPTAWIIAVSNVRQMANVVRPANNKKAGLARLFYTLYIYNFIF